VCDTAFGVVIEVLKAISARMRQLLVFACKRRHSVGDCNQGVRSRVVFLLFVFNSLQSAFALSFLHFSLPFIHTACAAL
jgi:hypothetical protein